MSAEPIITVNGEGREILRRIEGNVSSLDQSVKNVHSDMRDVRERLVAIEAKDLASRLTSLENKVRDDVETKLNDVRSKLAPIVFIASVVGAAALNWAFKAALPHS